MNRLMPSYLRGIRIQYIFMILKMVNNRTDAEDLMFEAFEKAFTSFELLFASVCLRLVRGYSNCL